MKNILVLLALILFVQPTSASAMTNDEFMSTIAKIEAQIKVLTIKLSALKQSASVVSTNVPLSISIDGQIQSATLPDKPTAIKYCESVAFDKQYMWKPITCTISNTGEVLYSGTFVAG